MGFRKEGRRRRRAEEMAMSWAKEDAEERYVLLRPIVGKVRWLVLREGNKEEKF